MSGHDPLTLGLALTVVSLFTLLVYVSVGIWGVLVVPLAVALFYILPGDVLNSVDENGVRVALLIIDGGLVGWIVAKYLGNPPFDEPGEATFMLGLTLFSFGFASVFTGLYSLRGYYHISRTETRDIASVDEGVVEVEGEIEPVGKTLTAPVSDEDCVAYEYVATQTRRFGSNRYRSTVNSGRDTVPFYVDDGTGRVLVDPEGAEIAVEERETRSVKPESSECDRETTLKEVRVPVEGRTYVFGSASWSDEHGQVSITDEGLPLVGGPPFFKVSDSSEWELIGKYKKFTVLSLLTALVGLPAGAWLTLGASGIL